MILGTLTAIQVENLCNPKSKVQQKIPKMGRTSRLACYVPNGDLQSSRRVTGAGLDPNGPEMLQAAMYFAAGLHRSTIDMLGDPGENYRSLIGPARYSNEVLEKYCNVLIKGAMGPRRQITTAEAISPLIVPYLLGGIPTKEAEAQCYRAVEVMEFYGEPRPAKGAEMQRALNNVGFGVDVRHDRPASDLPHNAYNHISLRQHSLLSLPPGDYAKQLLVNGAFGDSLFRLLNNFKADVVEHAERCLDPLVCEMTPLAGKDRIKVNLTEVNYWRAVRRVFEERWDRLDLSGRPEHGVADGEILMARNIISRISSNDRLTAEVLVGMSLLTGISVANWSKYAVLDHVRRGETFVSSLEIERAKEMIESNVHYGPIIEQQLVKDMATLRELERGETRWPRKLQSPNQPLWSTSGSFYLERFDDNDAPIYKHKPFSVRED